MSARWVINPVTLKELRQMVRSRLVASGLIGFLLLQLTGVGFMLLLSRDDAGSTVGSLSLGKNLFHFLYFLSSAVLLFCVTGYEGTRLALERGGEHLDLQFTTALTPRQFVDGKIASASVLIFMFTCSSLPFMVLSYLMRGLDLFRVFVAVALLVMTAVCCLYGALLLATLSTTRLLRGIFLLISVFFLFYLTVIVNVMGAEVATSSWRVPLSTPQDWVKAALVLAGCVTGCAVARVAMIAALSPTQANRDLPVRAWGAAFWLCWGVAAVAASFFEGDAEWVIAWAVTSVSAAAVMSAVEASKRGDYSRRLLASVSRVRLARLAQFPFFTGAMNGIVWALMIGFLSVFVLQWVMQVLPQTGTATSSSSELTSGHVAVFFLYLSAYVCTVRALWRFLLGRWLSYKLVGVVAAVLVVLGYALPYLLNFDNAITSKTDFGWQLGNAFAVFDDDDGIDLMAQLLFAGGWALLAWLACVPEFVAARQRFRNPQETA